MRKLTFDNAAAWELNDRGLVRTGFAADLVLFDEDGAAGHAGRGVGFAGWRATAGAKGGGDRGDDRQWDGGVRGRRGDRRLFRPCSEG